VYSCVAKTDLKGHGGFGGSKDSAVERLCRFITEVSKKKKKIYKGKFYPEVRATFERHVPFMSFPMNILFGNIGIFSPLIKKIMMGIPAASAMLSTSVAFTAVEAGNNSEPQMRAKNAEAAMFLRCVREEDLYAGLEKIKKIADKYGVEIEETERDFCRPTDFCGEAFLRVEALLHKNFPDVAVAPFLLTAGTDARRFTDVADNILRFAPIDLSKKQFATIHGDNEHIGVKSIGECVVFYKDYIKTFKGDTL
jgi:carboxypeptidase PM20D1